MCGLVFKGPTLPSSWVAPEFHVGRVKNSFSNGMLNRPRPSKSRTKVVLATPEARGSSTHESPTLGSVVGPKQLMLHKHANWVHDSATKQ